MNVYDFDETIYDGDSSVDFYLFCLRKQPKILKYVPKQILAALKYKLGKITKTQMKEVFFMFLQDIKTDDYLKKFWDKKEKNIKAWYLKIKKENDVIISASPEFLLKPICEKLKIKNLMASKVDKNTGKFLEENCKGKEKVKRFNEKFKEQEIEEFYSDSLSDTPLAEISKKAYLVDGNNLEEWPKKKENVIKK